MAICGFASQFFFCLKGQSGNTQEDKSIQTCRTIPSLERASVGVIHLPSVSMSLCVDDASRSSSWRQRRQRHAPVRNLDPTKCPAPSQSGALVACSAPLRGSVPPDRNLHPPHLIEQISRKQLLSASAARFRFITADKRPDNIWALQL